MRLLAVNACHLQFRLRDITLYTSGLKSYTFCFGFYKISPIFDQTIDHQFLSNSALHYVNLYGK